MDQCVRNQTILGKSFREPGDDCAQFLQRAGGISWWGERGPLEERCSVGGLIKKPVKSDIRTFGDWRSRRLESV